MKRLPIVLCLLSVALSVRAEETEATDGWFVGLSGSLMLPQGGSRLHRLGGAAVRGGRYLSENWAVEGEVSWMEDFAGLGVDVLGHFQGWDPYGDLFGYSRFDPFVTLGVRGWIGDGCGQVGPKVGLGAFYHLTDSWSLRADADAALGLETECEALYSLSLGMQCSF